MVVVAVVNAIALWRPSRRKESRPTVRVVTSSLLVLIKGVPPRRRQRPLDDRLPEQDRQNPREPSQMPMKVTRRRFKARRRRWRSVTRRSARASHPARAGAAPWRSGTATVCLRCVMPPRGRPKAVLELTHEERDQLQRWARRRKSSQALALRSRIVLACASGADNKTVAAELGCAQATVGKWRARFVEHRLDGLTDEERPGRPASIKVEQVEDVVVATLESVPANATHWSRAKMAERSGLSKSTIGRIWKTFELKPHRADGFKLSNDRCSWRRSMTSSGSTCTRPKRRSCSALMRRARCRRWPVPNRRFR